MTNVTASSTSGSAAHTTPTGVPTPARPRWRTKWCPGWCPDWLTLAILSAAAVLYALHFPHLTADFPNHSPWNDWAKYTDEGWYGDAAIRHYRTGHWYWQGDFNPAVALPVLPALELLVFKFTGVSLSAARAMTLVLFAVSLAALYGLIDRHTRPRTAGGRTLAAPLTVLFLCASPFFYVFERMAIIEPLLICLTLLALLTASHLRPLRWQSGAPASAHVLALLPALALGLLLPALVLAKTTAIALMPAIAYMVWARAGYRLRPALRLGLPSAALGIALWLGYYLFFVRPHYLTDYQYLFAANAYTGIELDPLATVVLNTLQDGLWMGNVVFPAFFVVVVLAIFWRPRLFTNPVFPALLLWIGGYCAFLMYHNNLQPRYYTIVAVPITAIVALGLDGLRLTGGRIAGVTSAVLAAAVALAILVPDIARQADFILHPTYDFVDAAAGIRQIVLADPTHSHLILSISGSDLTLINGLPSIDDDFGTDDLDVRVKKYRPGWYVAWNDIEDDKMDALRTLYKPVRVAAFPAMDDPDRDLLILYRLDPAESPNPGPPTTHRPRTPKPLVTRLGQQPSTTQLEH